MVMANTDWYVLILSMLPFTELRITIPWAIAGGMYPGQAFSLAVIGNLIPVIPILIFLPMVEKLLHNFSQLGSLLQKFLRGIRSRGGKVQQYGLWGLMFFVLIPLPGTGAWTGAILAWLFDFPRPRALLMIALGVCGAGVLVTLASLGLFHLGFFRDWEIVLLFFLLLGILFWRRRKRK